MAVATVSSVTLQMALGFRSYDLDADHKRVIAAPHQHVNPPPGYKHGPPALTLLEVPAAVAAHGFRYFDLSILQIPSIERSYLVELRAAFEESKVEIFQLLVDRGEVGSPDSVERSDSIRRTKRWMEVASELGATGIRYVPGDSEPTSETIRFSGEAFRELADYAVQLGLKPATENYKLTNYEADDLLRIIELSGREYGLVADFGNANGPNKYDRLTRLLPRATSIHAWALTNEDGTLNAAEFRRCLTMARDSGFDGPIMLQGGYVPDSWGWAADVWDGVDQLRAEVQAVFHENEGG